MEAALASAAKLFWRSYDRTSLADLTGAMGIAPASFYFAFDSKEALFRQTVDRYTAFQADAFDRAFQAPTSRAGVTALLRGYVDVVTDPGHAPGCLVVNNAPSAAGDAPASVAGRDPGRASGQVGRPIPCGPCARQAG